jgi:hypothetical protein
MLRVAQDWRLIAVPHSTIIYPIVVLIRNAKETEERSLPQSIYGFSVA